jgi:hypothetical protein
MLLITTSVSPSLSMSPNAAPRLTSETANTAPALAVTFSKRPSPWFRNSSLRSSYGNGASVGRPLIASIAPLTVRMSSRPSLSKSSQAEPNPL